ncbi:MAG: SurA N-terminal domain-containing protein [Lentisphaerae bacterium]|nr:SurA N-terminal domain-containing protein [Lentisphaerota bacterium]
MLITKFHQMIRHRVVWAVIATGVSLAFLVSFSSIRSCSGDEKTNHNAAGTLFGNDVSPAEFRTAMFFEMGLNNDRGLSPKEFETMRQRTWRRLAILRTAERLGITVPDAEIGQILSSEKTFQANGSFDKQRYLAFVQSKGVDLTTFEEYLRQSITIQKLAGTVEAAAWTAPTELEQRLRNLTDRRTVEYVVLDPAQSTGVVSIAESDARAFYDQNREGFTIPERVSVRYVTFPYSNFIPATVSSEEVQSYYDAHSEDFLVASTNTYSLPEPLEKVRPVIEAKLRDDGARFAAREVATRFVMDLAPDRSGKRPTFDSLAATSHLDVATTRLFAIDEPLPELLVDQEFNRAAFNLVLNDPELSFSDSIAGSNAVYVLTANERQEARIPAFSEIETTVTPLAKRQAQRQAFVKWAESVHTTFASGLATNRDFRSIAQAQHLNVATTGTFTVFASLSTNLFEHAEKIVPAVVELENGELSNVLEAGNQLIIAHQTSRTAGSAAEAVALRPQLLRTLQEYQSGLVFDQWSAYLLRQANFQDYQKQAADAAAAADESAPPPQS